MTLRKWFIVGGMLALAGFANAAVTYTGSLSTDGFDPGLTGNGVWAAGVNLSWTVKDLGSMWSYEYTLSVPQKDISHIIIEVSDTDIWINDNVTNFVVDVYSSTSQGGSNPGIPGSLTGVKYNVNGVMSYTISFTTNRIPVWGDFYAVDGQNPNQPIPYVFNKGFLDDDPIAPPSDGSIGYHILRPDSVIIVPVPGAILLAAMGTGLVGYLRHRTVI